MDRTARVVEISRFGPPEVMRIREETVPEVGPREVLIRVRGIGLNFADIFERLGLYKAAPKPPFVPGFEVAGEVLELGEEVHGLTRGACVLGLTRFGGYRTVIKLFESFVRPIPEPFSFEEAAGFPTTYLTAYHGLFHLAHFQKGEKVLIHAAAGGVGTAAVQLAQLYDAEIFATCGAEAKVKFLREKMGVKHVINYRTQDFEAEIRKVADGVDVIMDSVGGATFRKGYRLLNPMGRLIIFGLGSLMPSDKRPNWLKLAVQYLALPRLNPFHLISDNKTVAGFNLVFLFNYTDRFTRAFEQLLAWAAEGKLRTVVGKTFPFEEVAEAQNYLQSRASIGKVILTVED